MAVLGYAFCFAWLSRLCPPVMIRYWAQCHPCICFRQTKAKVVDSLAHGAVLKHVKNTSNVFSGNGFWGLKTSELIFRTIAPVADTDIFLHVVQRASEVIASWRKKSNHCVATWYCSNIVRRLSWINEGISLRGEFGLLQ